MVPLSEAVAIEQDTAEQLVFEYGHSRIREFILGDATKSSQPSPNLGAPFSLDGRLDMKLRGRWWSPQTLIANETRQLR
jgi:hypothetical protein